MEGHIKLYTIKRISDGFFIHPLMSGRDGWSSIPDYINAKRDKDWACGWKHRVSQRVDFEIEVCELTISWN